MMAAISYLRSVITQPIGGINYLGDTYVYGDSGLSHLPQVNNAKLERPARVHHSSDDCLGTWFVLRGHDEALNVLNYTRDNKVTTLQLYVHLSNDPKINWYRNVLSVTL